MTTQLRTSTDAFESEGQRLDVWLYRTRLFKSRSLATKMILSGKIRITRNGCTERITKPHVQLRPGNMAVFMRGPELIHIEMLATASRRGPAKEAAQLYRILPMDVSNRKTQG